MKAQGFQGKRLGSEAGGLKKTCHMRAATAHTAKARNQ
jgi:hypothetical protein